MAVQEKYAELINAAKSSGVSNLQVREQNNVLYIDGEAPSGQVKDKLWDVYNKLDPDFRSGDVVLDVKVSGMAGGSKAKVVTESSNLNIRKGPGTDEGEQGCGADGLGGVGDRVLEHEAFEPPASAAVHEPGVQADLNVVGGLQLTDQVVPTCWLLKSRRARGGTARPILPAIVNIHAGHQACERTLLWTVDGTII